MVRGNVCRKTNLGAEFKAGTHSSPLATVTLIPSVVYNDPLAPIDLRPGSSVVRASGYLPDPTLGSEVVGSNPTLVTFTILIGYEP